jgi:hypothetical protein
VRTAHTLRTGFVGLQVGCVPKGTHAVAGYGLLLLCSRLICDVQCGESTVNFGVIMQHAADKIGGFVVT